MTLHSRARFRFARAATIAVAALTVALTPLSAYAGGGWDGGGGTPGGGGSGSGVTTGGGGSTTGGGGSNYQCGQNIGLISGALYQRVGARWAMQYDANYPNCVPGGPGNYGGQGSVRLCTTGAEVYRFYQKAGWSTPVVTRSRLNAPSWCSGEVTYGLASQTSWDATLSWRNPGSPDYVYAGRNWDQYLNYLPSDVGRRDSGRLTSNQPSRTTAGLCTTASQQNPLIAWWPTATPSEQVGVRALLGTIYWASSAQGRYPLSGASEAGMSSLSGYKYATMPDQSVNPGVAPTPDPQGANFYAAAFTFDTRPCNSAWNFAKVSTTDAAGAAVVTDPGAVSGTCYVTLVRQEKLMRNSRGSLAWAPQALDRGFGERYSVRGDQFVRTGVNTSVPAAWRSAMAQDYASRGMYGAGNQQLKPGQVPPGDANPALIYKSSPYSAAQAVNDLVANAKCGLSDAANIALSGPAGGQSGSAGGQVDASVRLKMADPSVLQSGGATYRETFTVTAGQEALICSDGNPCGSKALLTDVSYRLEATGTAGYTRCDGARSVGCDFKVVNSVTGTVNTPGSLTVEFYNGTRPGQSFYVTASSLSAKYSYIAKSTQITLTGVNPVTGAPAQYTMGDATTTRSVSVTPTLTASPTPASYSDGAYTTQYYVISAVNVPR